MQAVTNRTADGTCHPMTRRALLTRPACRPHPALAAARAAAQVLHRGHVRHGPQAPYPQDSGQGRPNNRPILVYHFPRRALTHCLPLCMGIQPGARFLTRSADIFSASLYGYFTWAIYRNRPIPHALYLPQSHKLSLCEGETAPPKNGPWVTSLTGQCNPSILESNSGCLLRETRSADEAPSRVASPRIKRASTAH
jgi:hypothetical protein